MDSLNRCRFIAPAILLLATGCTHNQSTAAPGKPPAAAVVVMHFHSFEPESVTVRAGETVRWDNKSFIWHTVTDDPALAKQKEHAALPSGAEAFDSGKVQSGQSFSHVFTAPGTYRYFCRPHESSGMLGQVIVQPPALGGPRASAPAK